MAELEVHFPDGIVGFKPLSEDRPLIIGKGSGVDIHIDQKGIAPRHCVIEWKKQAYQATAIGKGRNVRVNGRVIQNSYLKPGDELTLSDYTFIVRAEPGEEIYDAVNLQFDLGALEEVERHGEAVFADKPKKVEGKTQDQYYVPLYRSPLFLSITGALFTLFVIGISLFLWVRTHGAAKQYDAAMEDVSNGLYASALRRFDRFLESYPEGELAQNAKVWRAIARVQQFTEGSATDWESGYKAAQQLYDEAAELPLYQERSKEIFAIMQKIGMGLAVKAREEADPAKLALAGDSIRFTERILPKVQDDNAIAAIRAAMDEAEFVIGKEQFRIAQTAEMEKALTSTQPIEVYKHHQQLYGRYPELRENAAIEELRERARQIEAKQIQYATLTLPEPTPTETTTPTWTLVRRTSEPEDLKPNGTITAVQVHDTVYGLDVGNGSVSWRFPTGFSPSFSPTPVAGEPTRLIVHCSNDNSLVLLDTKTGEPVWRQPLADRLPVPGSTPLIRRGNIMFFVTQQSFPDKGIMVLLRLQDGKAIGEYTFPQPLVGGPVLDSRRDAVLVTGLWSSLYDINLAEERCGQVIALNHEPSAVKATPVIAGRFLFVLENRGPDSSLLRCYVISERDGSMRERQQVTLSGGVWRTPAVAGGRLFLATDKNLVYVYELGGENDPKPLTPLLAPSESRDKASFQPFLVAANDHECWTFGTALQHYRFQQGKAVAGPEWQTSLAGEPVGPPSILGNILVVATNDAAASLVEIQGIDTTSHAVLWKCQVGERPEAIRTDPNKPTSLRWYDRTGDRELSIADLREDRIIEVALKKTYSDVGRDRQVTLRTLSEWKDGVVQWAGLGRDRLTYYPPGKVGRDLLLPSPVSGRPAVLENGLLIPGTDGFLYWIDPRTGEEISEPYMGTYANGRPSDLRSVTALDRETVIVVDDMKVIRLAFRPEPFGHFVAEASTDLDSVAETQLVNLGDRIVMAHGNELLSLNPKSLEVLDRFSLSAPVTRSAFSIGKNALFVTEQNEMVCLGGSTGQISILWKWKIDYPPVGDPIPTDTGFWIALSNGDLYEHALEDQQVLQQESTGCALVDGPWSVDSLLAVLTPDGSIASVSRSSGQ